MNRRKLGMLHPVMVYLFLTVALILVSLVGSFLELRVVNTNSELVLRSLLTANGLRYVMRESVVLLSNAPITKICLLLFTVGIANGSAMFKAISNLAHHRDISYKQKTSLLLSVVVFVLLCLLLLYGIVGPGHLLLSISGTLLGSPLLDGFFAILLILVALPSLLYGFATDTFRTVDDCIDASVSVIRIIPSYLLAIYMASFLIAVITYSRIDVLLGIGTVTLNIFSQLLYWLPLPILLIFHQKSEI